MMKFSVFAIAALAVATSSSYKVAVSALVIPDRHTPTIFDDEYESPAAVPALFDDEYESSAAAAVVVVAAAAAVPALFDDEYESPVAAAVPALFDDEYESPAAVVAVAAVAHERTVPNPVPSTATATATAIPDPVIVSSNTATVSIVPTNTATAPTISVPTELNIIDFDGNMTPPHSSAATKARTAFQKMRRRLKSGKNGPPPPSPPGQYYKKKAPSPGQYYKKKNLKKNSKNGPLPPPPPGQYYKKKSPKKNSKKNLPTEFPTKEPSDEPTEEQTDGPSEEPSNQPTAPSGAPSNSFTLSPIASTSSAVGGIAAPGSPERRLSEDILTVANFDRTLKEETDSILGVPSPTAVRALEWLMHVARALENSGCIVGTSAVQFDALSNLVCAEFFTADQLVGVSFYYRFQKAVRLTRLRNLSWKRWKRTDLQMLSVP